MTERLFVYGTLKRGSRHPWAVRLAASATYLGEARYNGRIYRIAHYPGVVPASRPDDWVFGDVFELRDPAILAALDAYEGCGPDDAEPTQYVRKLQTMILADGTSLPAWIYIYNWTIENREWIKSGRFDPVDL